MELSSWRREVPFGAYLQPIHLTVAARNAKSGKTSAESATGGSSPATTASPAATAAVGAADKGSAEQETNGGDPATPTPQSDPATAAVADADANCADAPAETAATVSAVVAPTAAAAEEANDVLSTPKRLKRRQKPAPPASPSLDKTSELYEAAAAEEEEVKVIPPFESECIQSSTSSKDSSARMVMNVGGPVWALDWAPQDNARRRKRNINAVAATAIAKKKALDSATLMSNGGDAIATTGDKGDRADGSDNDEGSDSECDDEAAANRRETLAKKWRFLALATHPPCEVVNGELVKKTPPDHYYNAEEGGARSLIQIWVVPVEPKKKSALNVDAKAAAVRKPKLVYGIDHHSGVAWDLQWSPITHAMPRRIRSKKLLGVLAVCFGDGSLQVFEVPEIAPELLTTQGLRKHEARVEKLRPTIHAKVPKVLQLSVQWSPHRWNLLLTGGSDGSVSLWNLEYELSKPEEPVENASDSPSSSAPSSALPMEPQRRFQDVDTVGKQEAFDWGWGWVAVRSVSWSPFDEFIFATTGNDSIFKVWDIREPRICFRSHRIRSTWGLSLQWMDQTTIQISGDQGSIYMYDTLSGSCQKLHYHPQIDSPVWDLQFARRGGNVPLLVSCCTSGSVRVAPAKKLFRAPQHSIEFCRLSGEKDASVDRAFKALTVSFAQKVVLATAESASPATRQFCERDAALHRLRMSTSATGAFPCFLAAGGHAGLVVILEIQEALDHLLENYFVSTSRKLGRPRKKGVGSPWSATKTKRKNKKQLLAVLVDDGSTGVSGSSKKVRGPNKKPGSHIKSKKMHNALTKYSSKTKRVTASGKKANGKKASGGGTTAATPPEKESEFPQFEMKTDSEEEEEEEEDEVEDEDDSEEESDSGLALMMAEEHSDDERISYSDGDMADEEEFEQQRQMLAQFNPESARMMSEYQLDLSEEDAIMLAIHMSELEQVQASPSPRKPSTSAARAKAKAKSPAVTAAAAPPSAGAATVGGKKKPTANSTSTNAKPPSAQKKKTQQPQQKKTKSAATGPETAANKDCSAVSDATTATEVSHAPSVSDSGAVPAATESQEGKKKKPTATASSTTKPQSAQKKPMQKKTSTPAAVPDTTAKDNVNAVGKAKAKGKAPAQTTITTTVAATKSTVAKKAQPKKSGSSKASSRAPRGAMLDGFEGYIMDQAATLQIIQLQNGMTEEDALIEAIRMSEMEATRAASSSFGPTKEIDGEDDVMEGTPEPVDGAATSPVAPTQEGEPSESGAAASVEPSEVVMTESDADPTVHRLEFTPLAKSAEPSTESTGISRSEEAQGTTVPPTSAAAVTTSAEDATVSTSQDLTAHSEPVVLSAKTAKPKPRPASTGKKKAATAATAAAAVKAPQTPASEVDPAPTSGATPEESDESVAAKAVATATDSVNDDAMTADTPAAPTSPAASGTTSATTIEEAPGSGAPPEESQKPNANAKAKAKAASSSAAAGKRKRPAAKAPPHKRPSKAGISSSSSRVDRTGAAGGQEESGYLTDEEALYLALRASEVEY